MKEKISGIVLGTVKHSDRHNVTGVYTRERGRMAFLTPAGASRQSRQIASYFQPLSIIEAQVTINPNRDLHIPTAVSRTTVWRTIYYEPMKMTVALFLSEFLNKLLRDSPAEPSLWDFIMQSMKLFDTIDNDISTANFHITFLIGLMRLTGIFPDMSSYTTGMEFDMKSGRMVLPFSLQGRIRGLRIDAERAAFLPKLARINYANCHRFLFNGRERSEILDDILRYYGCHFPGCDHLKSLEILKEIFR
ncbi:MAG: DNA repair protein RecO C-terminal domain-containing protein [Muribaculaceae bacterium]|nr:DNA repair protein RecO C-terminal domain-containing protein [Muribaculaceae bacterium]